MKQIDTITYEWDDQRGHVMRWVSSKFAVACRAHFTTPRPDFRFEITWGEAS
jgi:hypothetical protein